jgi:DNA-binding NtrC family response regulator
VTEKINHSESEYKKQMRQAKEEIVHDAMEEAKECPSVAARILGIDQGNMRRLLREVRYPGYPFHPECVRIAGGRIS